MEWRDRAACKETPTELFFPDVGVNVRPAKAICAVCPVVEPCLDFALGHPWLAGIFGGTSAKERGRIRSARKIRSLRETPTGIPETPVKRPAQSTAKCGTNSGYYRHIRTDKTPPCEPCSSAHAEAERQRNAAKASA